MTLHRSFEKHCKVCLAAAEGEKRRHWHGERGRDRNTGRGKFLLPPPDPVSLSLPPLAVLNRQTQQKQGWQSPGFSITKQVWSQEMKTQRLALAGAVTIPFHR